uniref:Uncharacterized protein n=1 Tax=Meloidogyne incognita TaxID=6306 RepID=A0A914LKX2_MELIC
MNDCAGLQASLTNGDCISLPPSYERQQMPTNPAFWNPQQQQQQIAFNNNNGANIQRNSLLFDTPTTSQNGNFDIIQQQQQLPQFTPEGPSPNISSPYFNNISQQQLKQFQDSQRKSVGGGTNIYQQQQQQEFQRPTSNFSSSGQPQFVDQQKIQQQISSPSVTSTADLLVPNGVGGNGGQQGNIQQGFPPHFQLPQNGMFDPSNNNNGGILDVNNPANFNMNGNCNSPMFRQSIQMNNNGQQSISSPLIGQQQHPQMIIPQQHQQQNPLLWQGMPPNMRMALPPNGQQQIVLNNGSEFEAPPFQMIPNNGGPNNLFGRSSFLFTSDFANKAAQCVKQRQVPDLAIWHAHTFADWHFSNPSTSKAFYGPQQSMNPINLPMRMNGKSPHPSSTPSTSRSNKRKASQSTVQEQQNSLCSPLQIPNNNNFVLPQQGSIINNNNPNIHNNMVLQQQQRFGSNNSKDVCDSSSNGADINNMFKRPDAISGDNSNNTPTNLQQQQQNYFCINSGNVQNIDGNIGRLDDENPLKKMEIMASKTLNEQPVNKMIKLGGGGDEEEGNANNFNKLNNNLQQQNCGDAAKQEKLRKLIEMESVLCQFSSFENNNNNNNMLPQPPPPNSLIQQQQIIQMQQQQNFISQQQNGLLNNNFPPPPQQQQFPPQMIDNIEMGGGGGQQQQQFNNRPPFFPNMIPPQHFNPMVMPPMSTINNNIQQQQQQFINNRLPPSMIPQQQQIFCTEAQLIQQQQQKIETINSSN